MVTETVTETQIALTAAGAGSSNLTQTLFSLSIAIFAGLLMSRVVKVLKLPAVTGYLIAGILIGPYCLGQLNIPGIGFISHGDVTHYNILSQVALGFIAFAIGSEFRLAQLKQTGKAATVIAFVQALMATLVVDAVLIALYFAFGKDVIPLPVAITLGAIATATAPAATLMVVKQYKAKGPVTSILLPIVALDDAIGLVVFAVSFGIAKTLSSGKFSLVSVVLNPIIEVLASLIVGALMGFFFTAMEKYFKSNSKRLCLSVTFIMLTVGITVQKFEIPGTDIHIGFSSLLTCMVLGTVFCNICDFSEELMEKTDKWTQPLLVLFFVLSGAELELSVFTSVAIVGIGIVYIIARSFGKCFGAFLGAKMMKCDKNIVKYLGVTLLPQAGVALGMSLQAANELGEAGEIIRNISLFAVLVYELVGPLLTKIALMKAGEITPKPVAARDLPKNEDEDE
ncbi:MAG: sodium:proton antiporter [Ruminococcaceae bacterium]|nr:sodium:proton antiporter [Oscillospiraceae bacterium]